MAIKAYLVEDHPDIRVTLIDGMESVIPVTFVGQASNEHDALRWLSAHHSEWDVLIVDLFLGKGAGSGFGVLQGCQQRLPAQKVVVLTSYVDEQLLSYCQFLGADAVFDKNDQIEMMVTYCLDHEEDLRRQPPQQGQRTLAALPLLWPRRKALLRAPQALPAPHALVPWQR